MLPPPSHPRAPLWAGRHGADGTRGYLDIHNDSWARKPKKKKGWGAQVGDGTTKTAPWVPRSLEDKRGAAGVGLCSILLLLLLFLCHPGSVWEGDGTRAWLARL